MVAVVLLAPALGRRAEAQVYDQVLPANLIRLTIGQQLIDIGHAPKLRHGNPSIEGELRPGSEALTLAVFRTGERSTPSPNDPPPQLVEEIEPTVDPQSGAFAAALQSTLDPGAYALYVNRSLAGVFTVETLTGADVASSSSSPFSAFSPTIALMIGVLLSIVLGGASLILQLLRNP